MKEFYRFGSLMLVVLGSALVFRDGWGIATLLGFAIQITGVIINFWC